MSTISRKTPPTGIVSTTSLPTIRIGWLTSEPFVTPYKTTINRQKLFEHIPIDCSFQPFVATLPQYCDVAVAVAHDHCIPTENLRRTAIRAKIAGIPKILILIGTSSRFAVDPEWTLERERLLCEEFENCGYDRDNISVHYYTEPLTPELVFEQLSQTLPSTEQLSPDPLQSALTTARSLVNANRHSEALLVLLYAWFHSQKSVEIAQLIDTLSFYVKRPAIETSPTKTKVSLWDETFSQKNPAHIEHLLTNLFDEAHAVVSKRIERLGTIPDPRIAKFLGEILDKRKSIPPLHITIVHAMITALVRIADRRVIPSLRRMLTDNSVDGSIHDVIRRAIVTIEFASPVTVLAPKCRTLCQAIAQPMLPPSQYQQKMHAIDQLFDSVYQRPDDDLARQRLASELCALELPQGEFIRLQLKRNAQGKSLPSTREKHLLQLHNTRWLGPLATVVSPNSVVYVRGFPVSVRLNACSIRAWADQLGQTQWSTIEHIECMGHIPIEVLTHPVMRRLKSLSNVPHALALELAQNPDPIAVEKLHIVPTRNTVNNTYEHFSQQDRWSLVKSKAFPQLRSLSICPLIQGQVAHLSPDTLGWLLDSALCKKLSQLVLHSFDAHYLRSIPQWIDTVLRHPSLKELSLLPSDGLGLTIERRQYRSLSTAHMIISIPESSEKGTPARDQLFSQWMSSLETLLRNKQLCLGSITLTDQSQQLSPSQTKRLENLCAALANQTDQTNFRSARA